MNRNTKYLNKRILELTEELEQDLLINEMEIKDKSLRAPGLKSKWIQIYYEELDYQDKLEQAKETLTEKFTKQYGQDSNEPGYAVGRKVAQIDEIKKLDKAITSQQRVVRFLNDVNKDIWRSFGYDLKAVLDYMKLESM